MTVLEVRYVTSTRKPWQCDGCDRWFPAGTSKERQWIVAGGEAYAIEWCHTCQGLAKELFALDSEFRLDGVNSNHLHESMESFGSWEAADQHFREAPDA